LAGDNTPKRTSTPAQIQSTADLLKLPKGRAYVVPKGFDEAGQVRYAGY
jgi:hypothetical protein